MRSQVRAHGFRLLVILIMSSTVMGCAVVTPSHRCSSDCQHFAPPHPLHQPILSDHPSLTSTESVGMHQSTAEPQTPQPAPSLSEMTSTWGESISFSGPTPADVDAPLPPDDPSFKTQYRAMDGIAGKVECHTWPADPTMPTCASESEVAYRSGHLGHRPDRLLSRILAPHAPLGDEPTQAEAPPAVTPPRPKFHPVPTHPVFRPQANEPLPRPIKQPFYFSPVAKTTQGPEAISR